MKPITRRRFVRGALGLTAAPLLSALSGPWIHARGSRRDYDAVVVGAGAAGLGAARALSGQGRRVLLLEAARRAGGRTQTDTQRFGVPYDLGAHWMHQVPANPLVDYARENGFSVYPAPEETTLYVGDRRAGDDEYRAWNRALDKTLAAIGRAGARGRDVSAAEVAPDVGEWNALAAFVIGPYEMGKDLDRFSCKDWWNSDDGDDWYCREGYGAVVAHLAADAPVRTGARVTEIAWGGSGVTVKSEAGEADAAACIITVSTGVLAGGGIRFTPTLPADKTESFHAVSMGHYNHIALEFSENVFGGDDGYLLLKPEVSESGVIRGMGLLTNISGSRLTSCEVGGRFAAELEREGEDACIDFALGELRHALGADIGRKFVKGHATAWGADPLIRGAYASAEPGAYPMRKVLRQPVADKLFFAGEACSPRQWATVHGAYASGQRAAEKLLAAVR